MKNIIKIATYRSPCGDLLLGAIDKWLCLCDWKESGHHKRMIGRLLKHFDVEIQEGGNYVIDMAQGQLDEYFGNRRKVFTVPLLPVGTEFQKKVWDGLATIPFGETLSYQKMAQRLGMDNSVRALANANGANALSIFIPCHRVIGSDGKLTGYAGGIDTKRYLLNLEKGSRPLF
ncbi:MAG: methylated-DNA--[protein]-cysteine S-methyltransferase [Muribaculaceae bacterium]|nr:methylated-DNA--[protein]-cysteine S-methyltransferase [Muribaculaceae bacterium]